MSGTSRFWTHKRHVPASLLEFPGGQMVLLTSLRSGQQATVLQLPAWRGWSCGSTPPPKVARSRGRRRPKPVIRQH